MTPTYPRYLCERYSIEAGAAGRTGRPDRADRVAVPARAVPGFPSPGVRSRPGGLLDMTAAACVNWWNRYRDYATAPDAVQLGRDIGAIVLDSLPQRTIYQARPEPVEPVSPEPGAFSA
jgi:hypothetical protein